MSPQKRSILIIGGSGALGKPLTETFLRRKDRFGRIAILSEPEKAHKLDIARALGAEFVFGSFLDAEIYHGFDIVFSLVGDPIMRLQPAMSEAAVKGGVRHFYPSEYGTDISQEGIWSFRYLRDKVVTRDHLRATAKRVPGFKYTLVLVGLFTEYACSPFSGFDLDNHTVEVYGNADAGVVRYIVGSVFLLFPEGEYWREIRARGDHLPFTEAAKKQEKARIRGDESGELMGAAKTAAATGKAFVPGPLDNDKFEFTPETAQETLSRLFSL
ncbi:unnamed protein product [Mycena citricolor]|uniref:NmrA-like domain-containing protein n=1 Tax=Mycena citricolor TaxID=2018698 RepID=A0AAD2HIB1_9AGAR|nr:unnamed protein product [Mycena citricolor]